MAYSMADLRYPMYEREAKPWPLPNNLTKPICILAGREASAALRIALGKHVGASVAHEATYYEPFAFWDWHGISPDDTYAREWKKQRMWEHHGGFTVDGSQVYGYPTPRERWASFKGSMESDPARKDWVERIAVAHWMVAEDLLWVAKNLTNLIALDLSDAPFNDTPEGQSWHTLIVHETLKPQETILNLLHRLEWLGLPDFRHSSPYVAGLLLHGFLHHCSGLFTLCVRSQQSTEGTTDPHELICEFPVLFAREGRSQLKRLELRLPFLCLNALLTGLVHAKSTIKHIGIDIGAWAQLLPKGERSNDELSEKAVGQVARLTAKKQRFETYESTHKERFPAEQRWRLPESRIEDEAPKHLVTSPEIVKHAFEHDFYNTDRQSKLRHAPLLSRDQWAAECKGVDYDHTGELQQALANMDLSTLPEMLEALRQASKNHPDFKLFPLEPEWQENSSDPLHPFALIQRPTTATSKTNPESFTPGIHQETYQWLNDTFKWRPVFDWDSLVRGKDAGHDQAYKQLWKRYGLDSAQWPCDNVDAEIAQQIQLMRSAGIPLHILLGRRHMDTPSLYWGWPYGSNAWSKWLAVPFGANIGHIAPLVDTLSIMYDVRDPIETGSPPGVSSSTCPRPVCPWDHVKLFCPFKAQWDPTPISPRGQKMANRHLLRPPPVLRPLAPHVCSLPPPGRYEPASSADQSPHVIAALKREAVGWHRFWSTYGPHFKQLTQLNVRMPVSFDTVGSVRLARLLDVAKGWREIRYATENGEIDLGGFVRRTWICQDPKASISEVGESEAEREKEQFQKAIKMAEEAARECEGVELRLQPPPVDELETGFGDDYGRRVRRVAEEAWRSRVRDYAVELAEHIAKTPEGEPTQRVLESTRRALQDRVTLPTSFRPKDVFVQDPKHRNNIGLVNYVVDYAAKENELRAQPTTTEPHAEDVSDDSIYNASPSPKTRDFAYDVPLSQDATVPGSTAVIDQLPGLHQDWSSQPQDMTTDTPTQGDSDISLPADLSSTVPQWDLAAAQLSGIDNLQSAPALHIPTNLEDILAALSRLDAVEVQQPVAPQPQVHRDSEVNRLLATLQQNTHQGQVVQAQLDAQRWSDDDALWEGEDDLAAKMRRELEGSHGTDVSAHEDSEFKMHVATDQTEERMHVQTSPQHVPGLGDFANEASETVIHREKTTHTQTLTTSDQQVGASIPRALAQEAAPVSEPVASQGSVPPAISAELEGSAAKNKSSREKKSAQPIESASKAKTTTPKKASPAKKTPEPKAPKVTKPKRTNDKAVPASSTAPEATASRTPSAPAKSNSPPAQPSQSSTPAPPAKKPPAKRKRKDPVIPDTPVDLSEGRTLRSQTRSRSHTPVYTEDSDEEGGGKKKGAKGGAKGKKRVADEEWEDGSVGDGGKGGKKKRKGKGRR